MRRIAVINQKGGVGKTTTAAHLGAALGLTGSRVLLVDMDPQAHLSLHFGVEVEEDQCSVYDVLTASLPVREALIKVHDSLHLVPADIDLAAAEAELISVMGREVILREAIDAVEDEYDVLLIDCPPSLGVLTINALSACHEVVIPLQAQFFALQGLGKLLDTVMLVQQRINPGILVKGVALCMHDSSTKLSNEIVDDLTEFLASSRDSNVPWSRAEIFKTRIRRNVKIAESSSFGQTVFEYEPKSNGAIDYNRLAIDIFDCPCVPGLEETLSARVDKVRSNSIQEPLAVERCVADEISIEPAKRVTVEEGVAVKVNNETSTDVTVETTSTSVPPTEGVSMATQDIARVVAPSSPAIASPAKAMEPVSEPASVDVPNQPIAVTPPPSSSPESIVSSI